MTELIDQLREGIVERLNLIDVRPEDIDPDAPLFEEGLGLDSLDRLELIVLLERQYGLKIEDPKVGKKVLGSVRSLAQYIVAHGKG